MGRYLKTTEPPAHPQVPWLAVHSADDRRGKVGEALDDVRLIVGPGSFSPAAMSPASTTSTGSSMSARTRASSFNARAGITTLVSGTDVDYGALTRQLLSVLTSSGRKRRRKEEQTAGNVI